MARAKLNDPPAELVVMEYDNIENQSWSKPLQRTNSCPSSISSQICLDLKNKQLVLAREKTSTIPSYKPISQLTSFQSQESQGVASTNVAISSLPSSISIEPISKEINPLTPL